ncbi:hypothetical protein JOB18_034853 [Solea senegalensis]|uniref:Uncharacterized protein n=1 Tax=Solea senegalensis TaxID=28829 RepID=A0AAV6T0S4_SOLSE|nr:hypothetical protein JOB18_034853 [Solea senegalensis]
MELCDPNPSLLARKSTDPLLSQKYNEVDLQKHGITKMRCETIASSPVITDLCDMYQCFKQPNCASVFFLFWPL